MVIPIHRFFVILSIGFAFSVIGFFFEKFSILQYFFYAGLLIITFVDFLFIIKRKHLKIERIHEKYLSIGTDNLIKIKLVNNSHNIGKVTIRDEYPSNFVVEEDTYKFRLSRFSFVTIAYYVKPLKKGNYQFESVFIRLSGFMNLIARQYKFYLPTNVKVYPNLVELKKYLNLVAKNRQEQIGYKRRMPGGETEFDFLRKYYPGDSYKKINWKATARKRFPIIKIEQKEYNRNVMVILDTGRMMTTRYEYLNKLDYAVDAILILAAAAQQKKDHFGLLAFSKEINSFLPSAKRNKILTNILPTLYKIDSDFTKTDYMLAYRFLKKRMRKNSIIFVFSELYNKIVSKELIELLKMLSLHHNVQFISFEEQDEKVKGKNYLEITRWALQQNQIVEKESIIRELYKKGIHTIRVNTKNIKTNVVNAYLSS